MIEMLFYHLILILRQNCSTWYQSWDYFKTFKIGIALIDKETKFLAEKYFNIRVVQDNNIKG